MDLRWQLHYFILVPPAARTSISNYDPSDLHLLLRRLSSSTVRTQNITSENLYKVWNNSVLIKKYTRVSEIIHKTIWFRQFRSSIEMHLNTVRSTTQVFCSCTFSFKHRCHEAKNKSEVNASRCIYLKIKAEMLVYCVIFIF